MGKDWIDLATSLGTVAAAVVGLIGVGVALWQAKQVNARIEKQELSRARLYASRISARLTKTSHHIAFAHVAGVFRVDALTETYAQINQYDHFRRVFAESFFLPDDETLSALIPLPNKCAHMLGRACDLLEALRTEVEAVNMSDLTDHTTETERAYTLKKWLAIVHDADGYLEVATRECLKAADLGAPFPTGEERYGNA